MPEPKKKYYAKESEKSEDDIANEKAYKAAYDALAKSGKDPLDTIHDKKTGELNDSELAERTVILRQRDDERRSAQKRDHYLQRQDEKAAFIAENIEKQKAEERKSGGWFPRTPAKKLAIAEKFWDDHSIGREDPDVEHAALVDIGEKGMAEARQRRADVQNEAKWKDFEENESLKERLKKKLMMK